VREAALVGRERWGIVTQSLLKVLAQDLRRALEEVVRLLLRPSTARMRHAAHETGALRG
jgi:hypothetical protein